MLRSLVGSEMCIRDRPVPLLFVHRAILQEYAPLVRIMQEPLLLALVRPHSGTMQELVQIVHRQLVHHVTHQVYAHLATTMQT